MPSDHRLFSSTLPVNYKRKIENSNYTAKGPEQKIYLYDCECADIVPKVMKKLNSNRIVYTFVLPEAKRKPEVNQQK